MSNAVQMLGAPTLIDKEDFLPLLHLDDVCRWHLPISLHMLPFCH